MPRLTTSTTIIVAHAIVVVFALTARFVQARPTAIPPAQNKPTPLYTDSRGDVKAGPLTIAGTLSAVNTSTTGSVTAQTLCLPNGGCRNDWPNLSRPNWTISDVMSVSSGISNRSITLGSISLNNVSRSSWPTWSSVSYGDGYYLMAPSGYAYCGSSHFMAGVSYCTGGGLCQIYCAKIVLE